MDYFIKTFKLLLLSWFRIVPLDQFLACIARYAFFTLFSMLKVNKMAHIKHFIILFSIVDSYDCVKHCIQVSVRIYPSSVFPSNDPK